jgi:hypothetical protein
MKERTMLRKVISGGQSGVDVGALRAAKACGLETGGTAAQGWMTEDGPAPWLATEFGLVECSEPGYPARTRANVVAADLSLLIGDDTSPGSRLLISIEQEIQASTWQEGSKNRPPPYRVRPVALRAEPVAHLGIVRPDYRVVARWITENDVQVLNVAGNRESRSPCWMHEGIGKWTERFLAAVFEALGHKLVSAPNHSAR